MRTVQHLTNEGVDVAAGAPRRDGIVQPSNDAHTLRQRHGFPCALHLAEDRPHIALVCLPTPEPLSGQLRRL
jgi:hypothetical protein